MNCGRNFPRKRAVIPPGKIRSLRPKKYREIRVSGGPQTADNHHLKGVRKRGDVEWDGGKIPPGDVTPRINSKKSRKEVRR
ncbi:hypothetical protein AKJ41_05040 [candidate division MSBL1 archaeon SCGC-AAA259O05]|uniref:Uncharacterized protein n=1 Tax=candidate division MSBL1 archaeon SCGC-AAA259O05 TaxID=1698271 RepID=A0A133UZT1_9EURY|nr:hypothetical protein AKJ41_05040 [candidate division MSBL1 archaeon SCGC-AAA259O05]